MKYKALFHLDVNRAPLIQMVLKNIANLLVDLGPENAEVRLVLNGDGVPGFTKNSPHLGTLPLRKTGAGATVLC